MDRPIKPEYLSQKQFDCLELFIKYGNKTKAGLEAGYRKSCAAAMASQLINSEKGQNYLQERYNQMDSEKVADADEVMQYLTSVMRGEINDQFDLDAPLSERTKAATELAKRLIDNGQGNGELRVNIINDIPMPESMKKKPKKKGKKSKNSRAKKTSK